MRVTEWEDWRPSGEKRQQIITRRTVVDETGREGKEDGSAIISLSYDSQEVAGPSTRSGLQLTLGALDFNPRYGKAFSTNRYSQNSDL